MRTEPPTGDELARMLVSMKRNVLERAALELPTKQKRQLSDRVIGAVVAVTLLLGIGTGAAFAFGIVPTPPALPQTEATTTPTPAPRANDEYEVTTATPTPPPAADPLTLVTTIVVRPERLDLQDGAGAVVAELSYDDETGHFIETLSAVLGEDPTVEERLAESKTYSWAGLTVFDALGTGVGYPPTNVTVVFELPTLGDGVAVATVSGFAPGDDLAAFAASLGVTYYPDAGENLVALEVGPERGPSTVPNRLNALTVAASDWGLASTGPSTVFAPFNFGREQGAP